MMAFYTFILFIQSNLFNAEFHGEYLNINPYYISHFCNINKNITGYSCHINRKEWTNLKILTLDFNFEEK